MSDRCYTVVESTRSVVVQPLDCDRTPIIVNEVTAAAVVQPVQETRHYVTFAGVPGKPGGNFPDVDVDGVLYGRKDEAWVPLGSAALANAGVFATAAQGQAANTAYGWGDHAQAGYAKTAALGTAAYEYVPASGNASPSQVVLGSDTRLADAREWTAATVSENEAKAGVATTRRAWTSERVRQSTEAWWFQDTVTSTNKTLAVRERCTVTAAGLTITLPASPAVGSEVAISIEGEITDTVVARNGSLIMGLAEDFTIDRPHVSITLVFVDATRGWRIF